MPIYLRNISPSYDNKSILIHFLFLALFIKSEGFLSFRSISSFSGYVDDDDYNGCVDRALNIGSEESTNLHCMTLVGLPISSSSTSALKFH